MTVRFRVSSPLPLNRSAAGRSSMRIDSASPSLARSTSRVRSTCRLRFSRFLRNATRCFCLFFFPLASACPVAVRCRRCLNWAFRHNLAAKNSSGVWHATRMQVRLRASERQCGASGVWRSRYGGQDASFRVNRINWKNLPISPIHNCMRRLHNLCRTFGRMNEHVAQTFGHL